MATTTPELLDILLEGSSLIKGNKFDYIQLKEEN